MTVENCGWLCQKKIFSTGYFLHESSLLKKKKEHNKKTIKKVRGACSMVKTRCSEYRTTLQDDMSNYLA